MFGYRQLKQMLVESGYAIVSVPTPDSDDGAKVDPPRFDTQGRASTVVSHVHQESLFASSSGEDSED